MNPPNQATLTLSMALIFQLLGLFGGVAGLIAMYRMAKERGAQDEKLKQLAARLQKVEDNQLSFEKAMLTHIIEIKTSIASVAATVQSIKENT